MTTLLKRLALCAALLAFSCRVAAAVDLDAEVARARAVIQEVSRLTPESLKRLGAADATRIVVTWETVGVVIAHEVAARAKAASGEEVGKAINAFFTASQIQDLASDELNKRVGMIAARADPAKLDDAIRALEAGYPAYANYQRRVRVRTLIARLDPLKKAAESAKPGAIPASALAAARASTGVRSVEYADGRFRVVFNERVAEGEALELRPDTLADGKAGWQCVASPALQPYLPPACKR